MENEQTKQFTFTYQTKVSDMYRFLMYHAYIGFSGIVNVVITVGALFLLFTGAGKGNAFYNAMLILAASLFTIINPIQLYYKAAKQVKLTPMFQKPLDYVVSSEGILVKQGEDQMLLEWNMLRKVVETKKDFYLYMSLTRAHVLPKEGYLENVETMREFIRENVTEGIIKIKK